MGNLRRNACAKNTMQHVAGMTFMGKGRTCAYLVHFSALSTRRIELQLLSVCMLMTDNYCVHGHIYRYHGFVGNLIFCASSCWLHLQLVPSAITLEQLLLVQQKLWHCPYIFHENMGDGHFLLVMLSLVMLSLAYNKDPDNIGFISLRPVLQDRKLVPFSSLQVGIQSAAASCSAAEKAEDQTVTYHGASACKPQLAALHCKVCSAMLPRQAAVWQAAPVRLGYEIQRYCKGF